MKSTNAIEKFNDDIGRVKTISSFPDTASAEKIFYYRAIKYNSRHAFGAMNGSYKSGDEIMGIFQKRYLYKYTEFGTLFNFLYSKLGILK